MSQKPIPFQVKRRAERLILQGDLDGEALTRRACPKALADAARHVTKLTIDASNARVVPDGITIWIAAVTEFLGGVQLHYTESHLADLLQNDSRYTHRKSTFQPSDLGSGSATQSATSAKRVRAKDRPVPAASW